MQSVTDISDLNETKLVPASELKAMTVSKEDLFKRQKESVLDSVMSSMVTVATDQGALGYSATLNSQFDAGLLAEIVTEFKALGYVVTTEAKTDAKLGALILLDISWK